MDEVPQQNKLTIASRFSGHLKRNIIILLAIVLVAGVSGWFLFKSDNSTPSTAKNTVLGNYQKDLPGLASKAQANPKDPKALQAYGVALYATGDYSKAQSTYESAVKVDSKNAVTWNNLGNTYRDLNNYPKAIEAYQTSIRLNPKTEQPYINLGNIYLYTLAQNDTAIKTYQEAIRNIPDSPKLEILLGIAYEKSGDKNNAKATFQKVLNADPNNTAAQAGLKRVS